MDKGFPLKLQSLETMQLPEKIVIEKDGKVVDTSAIDDYDSFMQFLMMASMASNMAKVREYFEDRTSNGYTQFWNPIITQVRQRWDLDYAAQSMSLLNDGPNNVWIWINNLERRRITVNNGENFNLDFERHKLRVFWAQCAPAQTATLRVACKD